MAKQILFSENAPAPIGPYSQGVEIDGIVFFSGQIPLDPTSGTIVGGSAKEQAAQVMKNIQAMLVSSGLSFSNVVKTTIFLTDMADFATVNEVYGGYFQSRPPARSTVAVAGLPKNVKVEIEVICARKA
jgi:2-iminobutanoate/2-iminopropanoate deaminase